MGEIVPLTRKELLEELRGKENSLLDDEQDFRRIAEAVWPEDSPNEAPPYFREEGIFERDEIIAGIESLHELCDRLMAENDQLRDALHAVEVGHG